MIITEPKHGNFFLVVESWDWDKGAKEDIEFLKRQIPSEHRSYDMKNKQWVISSKYRAVVASIFQSYSPTTEY